MPVMSSDQLRDVSVAVVEDFINNKTPLSEGLAKQAALNNMNSEQVQRCVEAANTIAHLKLISVAEDRTFEFPLCKYAEVMQRAALPDFEKSAGLYRGVVNTLKESVGFGPHAAAMRLAKSERDALPITHPDWRGLDDRYQSSKRVAKNARDLSQAGVILTTSAVASPIAYGAMQLHDKHTQQGRHEKSAGLYQAVKSTFKDATREGEASKALTKAMLNEYHAKNTFDAARQVRDRQEMINSGAIFRKSKNEVEEAAKAEEEARKKAQFHLGVAGTATLGLGTAGVIGAKHLSSQAESKTHEKVADYHANSQESRVWFTKSASANKAALEYLKGNSEVLAQQLTKLASKIKLDEHGLDKIACALGKEDARMVSTLVYGVPKVGRDFGAAKDGIFKQAELKDVLSLAELYKEARDVLREVNERTALADRCTGVNEGFRKEASFAAAGELIGKGVAKITSAIGSGLAAPVKGLATIGGNALKPIEKKTTVGPISKAFTASAATAGTLGLNGMMLSHDPGFSQSTGRSRNVWEALQA